jgi:hypothetical protein
MIASAELAIQRRLTESFVNADYVILSLVRTPRISDGAGGFKDGTPVTLAPQTFRLTPSEDGATARTTSEGETATPEYMLIGAYTVDLARFDRFTIGSRRYEVTFISENRQYEVKGEVNYLGE